MELTALVAGATGLIGSLLIEQLTVNSQAKVVALARRAAFANIETRIVNFDTLSPADCAGADVVFCALGTTIKKAGSQEAFRRVDLDYVTALAKASHGAGARQFLLVSSVGADPQSSNFYLRVKGETEEAVRAIRFAALHIFRPSLLLGDRNEARSGEGIAQVLMPILNPLMIGGLRKYRAVHAEQVARAMIAAASRNVSGVHTYEYNDIISLGANY